ncbi:class I adenylate-forming enzyme family protein [Comamonadaceae bacterium G21597-S1]|nr:class I adenylate-forming enzyme family protein [Comamonadaceae bacterium G21597-S1]
MSHLLTLHDPSIARENYLSGIWQTDTLYSLARWHATERGNAHAVRDPSRRLTWSALVGWVDALAADLHEAGLRRGDRVSIWLPNRLESVVILLACSRNGYVCNPSLHQNYTVSEIAALLTRIECRALFAQPGYGSDAETADIFARASDLAHMKRVYALPSLRMADADLPASSQPMPMVTHTSVAAPPVSTRPDQIVYLAFTSGTTGTPKGVMHSDNTLLSNGRAMVADWGHDEKAVLLTLSPMSHHIGTVALEQALVAGCELAMHDPSAGITALDWIVTTGATYVMGVPTHAIDLLHEVDKRQLQQLGAVKVFYMAGAPIPTEIGRRLLSLGATPQNVYGMTENGSHQYTKPSDSVDVITSTCGKACKGYEVRLWDPENPDLAAAPGEVGEIGGRGGVLMLGYFNNQSATENSFNSSGWFLSGDLGRFDPQGNLQIVGRKKDLIIRGGHNIHPAHIEEYAHRHPAVKKAAAFGVADERLGEKVCLALICHAEAPNPQEILQHLAGQGLSRFDMPEFFAVVTEFPMTASGKILKRELVQWVSSGRLRPESIRYNGVA